MALARLADLALLLVGTAERAGALIHLLVNAPLIGGSSSGDRERRRTPTGQLWEFAYV
jgi:hypothetical protein